VAYEKNRFLSVLLEGLLQELFDYSIAPAADRVATISDRHQRANGISGLAPRSEPGPHGRDGYWILIFIGGGNEHSVAFLEESAEKSTNELKTRKETRVGYSQMRSS
jgi:hypothetical protein